MIGRARAVIRSRWARLGKRQRRLLANTAILLTLGIIFALITLSSPFGSLLWTLQHTLADQLFLPVSASPNIVIVTIDDATLEAVGKRLSEWPRSLHAQAIENLSQAGAGVIGFDILFAETSDPDEDAALAEAMMEAGNVVQPILGTQGTVSEGKVKVFQSFLQPNPVFYSASATVGHANVLPDPDGKVRRLPLIIEDTQGESYPALSLAVLHTFNPLIFPENYTVQDGAIQLPDRAIPVDASNSMLINYVGKPGAFTRISYQDVIEGNFDPDLVKHKIVLIGVTAVGEADYWVTPVSGEKMFGVEIHANAIDTILRERFLREAGHTSTLLIILLLVGITSLSLPRFKLRWGILLVIALILAYLVLAVFIYYWKGYIMNLIYPPLGLLLIYVASIICRIATERIDKREVKDLFGKYVSPQVAGEILRLSDAEELKLGGEQYEVTVLFLDIRGFTRLSEQMSPEGVVNMLNKYFSVIIARILANDGMINKFAGDSIMAIWNAPQSQPKHALMAVRAAIESQKFITEMQQREPDLPQAQFGFGINTGPAIAGNVGSTGRMEYTVIGDAVNLASRICGATPGGKTWISEQTYEQVKGEISATVIGPQQFKGKEKPVTIYQVEGQ
jgi:adenylate cyclase